MTVALVVVTSALFVTISIHAAVVSRGRPLLLAYAAVWALLAATSVYVHMERKGHGHWRLDEVRRIDKVLVYTAIALGAVLYIKNVNRLPYDPVTHLVPVVTFLGCVVLYHGVRDLFDHVWVHVCTLIGHHAIVYGAGI